MVALVVILGIALGATEAISSTAGNLGRSVTARQSPAADGAASSGCRREAGRHEVEQGAQTALRGDQGQLVRNSGI